MLLKTYLAREKQTPAAFAASIKMTRAAVCHWLAGIRKPDLASIEAIEAATGGKVTRRDLRPDLFPSKRRVA